MMEISAGKLRGLRRLADAQGFFSMLAVDQRPPIMNHVKAARNLARAPDVEVAAIKRTLVTALGPSASAVLCDPVWAYPFAHDAVLPGQGLIVTLEDHRFEDGPGGRRTHAIPGWSVEKIKRMGGDGVKVLAWFRPDAAAEVIEHQERFVRAVGEDCRRFDLPFVLELLVYPFAGGTHDYVEDPAKRPELVLESVRRFADPAFGVDLFKLESPLPATALPDPASEAAGATQALFDELGRLAGRPWVLLSAGASAEAFERALGFACRAGASGFLAGRAIWWQAFQHYPDMQAMGEALVEDAAPYLRRLGETTAALGTPWDRHPAMGDGPALADVDFDFPTRYGGMA
jgi:tagatose 1,6-diphosphate aldolase